MQPEEKEKNKRVLFNETMTSKTISQKKSGWEKDWQKLRDKRDNKQHSKIC